MSAERILKNAGALAVARGVTAALTLVTTVYLGRVLEPEAFGMLSWGTALLVFFLVVPNLGLNVYGVRVSARSPDAVPDLAGRILALRLVLATAAGGAFVLVVRSFDLDPVFETVVLIQGLGLFVHAVSLVWVFEGQQRMAHLAVQQVTVAVLATLATLAFVKDPGDVVVAAALPVLALLVGNLWLGWSYLRQFGRIRFRWGLGSWAPLIKSGFPIATSLFMVQVYTSIDQVMLGALRSSAEVGLYAVAYRFVTAGLIPLQVIIQAFAPTLSTQASDTSARRTGGRSLTKALSAFAWPIAVGGGLLSGPLMDLFGEEYAGGATALLILMGGVLAGYFHTGFGRALIYWDRERVYMWALCIGALTNVGLNAFWIPAFGGIGAAWATVATEVCVLLVVAVAYRRSTGALPFGALFIGGLAAALGVAAPILLVRALGGGLLLQLVAMGVAYPISVWATGLLPPPVLAYLQRSSSKIRRR